MKTPVSRVGNKSAIRHILYALFPLEYERFIDVFGGSGSVLLDTPTVAPFEVYNDFDRDLVNLFRCLRDRNMAFLRELGFCHLNARGDFYAWKRFLRGDEDMQNRFLQEELELTEILSPPFEAKELQAMQRQRAGDYDVRRSVAFFKQLRCSYASKGDSFGGRPFNLANLHNLVQAAESRLQNVVIENQDFETLIQHYDRENAFFYLDPPYFSTEDMYDVPFRWEDHVRLRETLGQIQGKFLLSYNQCPEICELYEGYEMFFFYRNHSMRNQFRSPYEDDEEKNLFPELLIANYDLYERERVKPVQLDLFGADLDSESAMRERIVPNNKYQGGNES